jgi:putative addiction module killer protein
MYNILYIICVKPKSPTTIVSYQTAKGKIPFDQWISRLDRSAAFKVLGRIRQMSSGSLGDVKSVGSGVMEARVHFGPGYRIYFAIDSNGTVLVLLVGGDKSSQDSDIEKAKGYWLDYKERT